MSSAHTRTNCASTTLPYRLCGCAAASRLPPLPPSGHESPTNSHLSTGTHDEIYTG